MSQELSRHVSSTHAIKIHAVRAEPGWAGPWERRRRAPRGASETPLASRIVGARMRSSRRSQARLARACARAPRGAALARGRHARRAPQIFLPPCVGDSAADIPNALPAVCALLRSAADERVEQACPHPGHPRVPPY